MSSVNTNEPRKLGERRAFRISVAFSALVIGAAIARPALPAEGCSIEALGPNAYERVKKKIEERFYKSPEVTVESYAKAEVTLLPECVLQLHGRFTAKDKGRVKRKEYDARTRPKQGAPLGIEILKLKIDNG